MRSEYFGRISLVGTIALCVTTVPFLLAIASGQSAKAMTVKSAARAERFGAGTAEVTAKPGSEVVLVVRIEGLSEKEWGDLAMGDLAVSVVDRRFPAHRKMVSASAPDSSGGVVTKPLTVVVFLVPKDQLKFTLFAGKRPPISFTAETRIQQVLSQ